MKELTTFFDKNGININIDEDGIFSALILDKLYGVKINGFNNNDNVVTMENGNTINDTVFIDLHTGYPDLKSIDQHCVSVDEQHNEMLKNNPNKINPNIEFNRTWDVYARKFCYSTTIFLIAKAEGEGLDIKDIDLHKKVTDKFTLGDLIWYTDSSFLNYFKYNRNAMEWNDILLQISNHGKFTTELIDYLLSMPTDEDEQQVLKAEMSMFFKRQFGCTTGHGNMDADILLEDGSLSLKMFDYIRYMAELFNVDVEYLRNKRFHYEEGFKTKSFKYSDYQEKFDSTKLFSYGFIWNKKHIRNNIRATWR